MNDPNLAMLKLAIGRLGPLVRELVFVGGSTTGLYITDKAAADVRPTDDVDTIVEATTYAQYQRFSERLRAQGFAIDTREGAPLCRWINGETVLDVMPLDEATLGFTNIWYREGQENSVEYALSEASTIRILTPAYFCATKLEAYKGRGNNDYFGSHDLEDVITVVDGREALVDEIRLSPVTVRQYLTAFVIDLLNTQKFIDALPGHLLPDEANQSRVSIVMERLSNISEL